MQYKLSLQINQLLMVQQLSHRTRHIIISKKLSIVIFDFLELSFLASINCLTRFINLKKKNFVILKILRCILKIFKTIMFCLKMDNKFY